MQDYIEYIGFVIIISGFILVFIYPLVRELRSFKLSDIKKMPDTLRNSIFIFFICLSFIFYDYFKLKNNYAFKEKAVKTSGKVYEVYVITDYKTKRETIGLKYSYKVGTSLRYSNHAINVDYKYAEKFKNKTYPLLYDSLNPESSYLIVVQRDYSNFGMLKHDSMRWIEKYEKN